MRQTRDTSLLLISPILVPSPKDKQADLSSCGRGCVALDAREANAVSPSRVKRCLGKMARQGCSSQKSIVKSCRLSSGQSENRGPGVLALCFRTPRVRKNGKMGRPLTTRELSVCRQDSRLMKAVEAHAECKSEMDKAGHAFPRQVNPCARLKGTLSWYCSCSGYRSHVYDPTASREPASRTKPQNHRARCPKVAPNKHNC